VNQRISLQPTFVLHSRHYGDSSLILEALTQDYGRVSLLAKGHRKKIIGGPQVLSEMLVSWSGRGEMKTLTAAESVKSGGQLLGRQLYAALYINELLIRLLPKYDAHPQLFQHYRELIPELARRQDFEPLLRQFELHLLTELGYALDLSHDAIDGTEIEASSVYRFVLEQGLVPVNGNEKLGLNNFLGADIHAIAAADFSDIATRRAAKRLLRLALAPLLGPRPLKSRELFSQRKAL
jgi:DNA repair protein RecO (recombination protein O)